ncbi:MAG TPA: nucleotide sugar dehydrogenase [Candidatus Aquilonibacter sp.]|nr:nucleotide sugar dehydrogenase [Candidatus Aquilonibacter sp.]
MRHVSVFGLGYVGAVTAACLASRGSQVIGVDVSPRKVQMFESGHAPVLEPGLEDLVIKGRDTARLCATTDAARAVRESEISFVCVGTPSMHNGRVDLTSVEHSCREIGRALRDKDEFHWIVVRSTVLPGTGRSLVIPTLEAASGRRAGVDFAVCSNPEFTREGCAVSDYMNPAMTVIGCDNRGHLAAIRDVYREFPGRLFETSLNVSEMVKYTCNAFHALKIAFANEIGTMCKQLDVDVESMMEIFTSDTKLNISTAYLKPGAAFGGSCLPKDLRAISYRAKQLDVELPLLNSILASNDAHLDRAIDAIIMTKCKNVSVLGLSFKPGTDDLRESPYVRMIKQLLGEGCNVKIWDPDVALGRLCGSNRQFIEDEIPHIGACLSSDLEGTVRHGEVVALGTNAIDRQTLDAMIQPDQIVIDLLSPLGAPKADNVIALAHVPRTNEPIPVEA